MFRNRGPLAQQRICDVALILRIPPRALALSSVIVGLGFDALAGVRPLELPTLSASAPASASLDPPESLGDPVSPGSTAPAAQLRNHARARLLSETGYLAPGRTNWLALQFEIDPGWHLYWNGRNDSGYPPTLELALPPGWTLGPIEWPAPDRLLSPGDILDHVYSREVALLLPLRVPDGLTVGSTVNLEGRAGWLACKDACIPESAGISLYLPVAASADVVRDPSAVFERFRGRVPSPLAEAGGRVGLTWASERLRIRVPDARGLSFFPAEECSPLAHPIQDTSAEGATLTLRFETEGVGPLRAIGILEVRGTDPTPRWYALEATPDSRAQVLQP